jgi:hypothetical protein
MASYRSPARVDLGPSTSKRITVNNDRIILIITVTISIVVVVTTISPLITGRPLANPDLLSNLVSSLIAIVSFSLGRKSDKDVNP